MTLQAVSNTIELDIEGVPDWWADAQPYMLAETNFGQVRATIYKATDRVLHVYLEDDDQRAVRAQMLISTPKGPTLGLNIGWDQESAHLGLVDQLNAVSYPWCKLPLPVRP